jgi:D-alanyl-D-alanine-carboxypeptidase/D-alanyl-D-alanine-endopeptidase
MNQALSFSYLFATLAVAVTLFAPYAQANDKLLDETVEFTGTILFVQSHVPALVIGVVRDGQTAVFGFGEIGWIRQIA